MRALAVAIGVAALAAPAHAEPTDFTLPRGGLAGALSFEVDLPRGALGERTSLAPSLWYGLDDHWTLGVIHGNASVSRLAAGAGLCTGEDCDATYSGAGLDVRYGAVAGGAFTLVPRARLLARTFDPGRPALTVGALARYRWGPLSVTTDLYLRLGLAARGRGNRDALMVPLWLGVQASPRWSVALRTGYDSEVVNLADGYHIPLGLAVTAQATRTVDLAVEIGFASLLGPQSDYKALAALVTLELWASPRSAP